MSAAITRLLLFSRQFEKFYEHQFLSLLERSGLTMREIHVLLFLANNPGYDTARDVTEYRGIAKSQVSQAVDTLAGRNLLCRIPDAADRRVVRLAITAQGAPLASEAQTIQAACAHRLLAGLSPEDAAQFRRLLDTVLESGIHLMEEEVQL